MGKTNADKSKKKHKHKRKKSHKEKQKLKKSKKDVKLKKTEPKEQEEKDNSASEEDFAIPIKLMNNKSHAPERPEEYQRRQSQIRREVDPVTGRTRLIKGDGEVLEEIVTKKRHVEINKKATRGDGDFFEEQSLNVKKIRHK